MALPLTIAALAFAAVALLVGAVLDSIAAEERRARRALEMLTQFEAGEAALVEPLLRPVLDRTLRPGLRRLARYARRLTPAGARRAAGRRLVHAGLGASVDAERFFLVKAVLAVTGAVAVVVAALLFGLPWPRAAGLAALAGAAAFFAPDLWLSSAVERRQTAIRRTLPEMLDMLTISVQAGLGLDSALAKLVRGSRGPLAEEFARMLQEVQAGVSRREALRNLADRTDVPELTSFVLAMIQADVFGISVNTVLRNQSQELRMKRRQRAEELAQKTPVKIVFPVVLCILPATLLVVLGPAIVAVSRMFGHTP